MLTEVVPQDDLHETCGVLQKNDGQSGLCIQMPCIKEAVSKADREKDVLLKFINQMIAVAFEEKSADLLANERGDARRSRARQVAMYLMNVSLSRSFAEISAYYGRDRTTVRYACQVVETLRDLPAFDDRMIEFENTISLVVSISGVLREEIKGE